MTTAEVLKIATEHIAEMKGKDFDLLEIKKPVTPEAAVNLSKIVSKLSPLLGNMIEFNTVELLNLFGDFKDWGTWKRQDPGFPDTIFHGKVSPTPGLEIKAWFPLATEITARFKDSQKHFLDDQTHVALLAWLPEHVIYGKPCIIDVCVVSGMSVAQARDGHYHAPPDYLVLEPEDTTARTVNLQQTNTNGYKFQGTADEFEKAQKMVEEWGENGKVYNHDATYQTLLRTLIANFSYRLDTNFAKMDRIEHAGIETFKKSVMKADFCGLTVGQWSAILARGTDAAIKAALKKHVGIDTGDVADVLDI